MELQLFLPLKICTYWTDDGSETIFEGQMYYTASQVSHLHLQKRQRNKNKNKTNLPNFLEVTGTFLCSVEIMQSKLRWNIFAIVSNQPNYYISMYNYLISLKCWIETQMLVITIKLQLTVLIENFIVYAAYFQYVFNKFVSKQELNLKIRLNFFQACCSRIFFSKY